ncbi:hypothetical protein BKA82DRAFT_4237375 [Pisolithus tinctorius]|nr:hypothetical protein BKA82DRAFT_4237375 [Pisolithus tinctorius]
MVRTRSSTKNAKGGSASRVSISAMIADAVKVKANCEQAIPETTYHSVQEREPEPTGQHHNFCILCQDGGDLWPCSNCERVVCSLCMTVPVEVQEKVRASDIVFECVCCHWLKSRRSSTVTPYWGFYRDGTHVFEDWLKVNRPMELSVRSSLLSHPTLVIHLRLQSIPAGGPVEMATQVLAPYFPNGGFRFIDLPFDIGTKSKLIAYQRRVQLLVTELRPIGFKNVMVALTDHSDNSRGDLFFGATPGGKNKASLPSECLDALLSPFDNILHGGLFVLLACGSVVRNEECFVSLQDAVVRHRFSSTIAFDAERLQTVLTSNLIMGVVERTFIEGYPVQMAMPEALGESSRLGYHSNVYLLTLACTDTTSRLTITKFMWSHRDIRPWGAPLPTQCPQCGCIQVQWVRTALPHDSTSTHEFKCANNECGKVNGSGPQKFRFTKAPDITLLKPGKRSNSAWLEMPMGVREFPLHVS